MSRDEDITLALDRMCDFALLPNHIQELGERLQRERDELHAAASAASDAWDAWMNGEDDEGQGAMEDAIGRLRKVLRQVAPT
jgi:hypothetical protein